MCANFIKKEYSKITCSLFLFMSPSVCLCLWLFVCLSVSRPQTPFAGVLIVSTFRAALDQPVSTHPCVVFCFSLWLWPSWRLPALLCLSVCPSLHVGLSVCLTACMTVCLSIRLSLFLISRGPEASETRLFLVALWNKAFAIWETWTDSQTISNCRIDWDARGCGTQTDSLRNTVSQFLIWL